MSKSHPILFSAPMVRAILDNRKTQTRRVVKPQHGGAIDIAGASYDASDECWAWHNSEAPPRLLGLSRFRCPYGVPGDTLWVKESHWCELGGSTDANGEYTDYWLNHVEYAEQRDAAGWRNQENKTGWMAKRPSIHMPRSASRITLTVKSVRVERLQDISEEDARAEGVAWTSGGPLATALFEALWKSINGTDSWAANLWVWVVEFERTKP